MDNVCRICVTCTKKRKMSFFKDVLWGRGGVPTGAGLVDGGGRPRALVAGDRGWMAVPKKGLVGGLLGSSTGRGKGSGGNPRASVPEG